YLIAGNDADAQEAAQDAFIKAYRALGRFRQGFPFRPWLLRIVANEARNRRRSAGRRQALALRAMADAAPGDAAPSPEAALVAVGIAFAVPPARAAILRFLGLEGVTIVRVEKLPPATSSVAVVGNPTTLDGAARRLGFRALLPDIGAPDAVYLDPSDQAMLIL